MTTPITTEQSSNAIRMLRECGDHHSAAIIESLAAQVEVLTVEGKEQSRNMLLLISDIRYVAGIAERGRGSPLLDGEKFTEAVLNYVKSLEAERDALQASESTAVPVAREDEIVDAFEKWAESEGFSVAAAEFGGGYEEENTAYAWYGWKAAHAEPKLFTHNITQEQP